MSVERLGSPRTTRGNDARDAISVKTLLGSEHDPSCVASLQSAHRMLERACMDSSRAPAIIVADASPAKTPARSNIFGIGEVLSDTYEILRVLGAGGMGQVFEAHDRALDRRIAIKAAWPGSNPGQLRAEARAMAAVKHACVAAVYAVHTHRDIEYVAIERLYGVALGDLIAQRTASGGAFEIDEVVSLLRSLADALAAVHHAGIAHHDMKPENVMLVAGDRVVLMDLGIVLPEVNVRDRSTVDGSPAYMAPEVITGTTRPGMAQIADLYALGVVAFELLTGTLPFDGETSLEIWRRHLSERPRDVRTLRPETPDALAELVNELLAKDPSERPESAESVAWSLGAIEARRSKNAEVAPAAVRIVAIRRETGESSGSATGEGLTVSGELA